MSESNQLSVEIAYALAEEQVVFTLSVANGTTLEDAIKQSEILTKYPSIDLSKNKVGIYGKVAKLSSVVRDGDRVEIYRPLIADPKAVRKERADAGKKMKKGGGAD